MCVQAVTNNFQNCLFCINCSHYKMSENSKKGQCGIFSHFIMTENRENQQILTLEKLKPQNGFYFQLVKHPE